MASSPSIKPFIVRFIDRDELSSRSVQLPYTTPTTPEAKPLEKFLPVFAEHVLHRCTQYPGTKHRDGDYWVQMEAFSSEEACIITDEVVKLGNGKDHDFKASFGKVAENDAELESGKQLLETLFRDMVQRAKNIEQDGRTDAAMRVAYQQTPELAKQAEIKICVNEAFWKFVPKKAGKAGKAVEFFAIAAKMPSKYVVRVISRADDDNISHHNLIMPYEAPYTAAAQEYGKFLGAFAEHVWRRCQVERERDLFTIANHARLGPKRNQCLAPLPGSQVCAQHGRRLLDHRHRHQGRRGAGRYGDGHCAVWFAW